MLLTGDSNNPILHVEELPRWPWDRPRMAPGATHVYLTRSDKYLEPRGGFTLGEMWWHGLSRVYVVDVAVHRVDISREVMSRASGLTVALAVACSWRVADAIAVVDTGLVDVRPLLRSLLTYTLDTALAEVPWQSARGLSRALASDLLPTEVQANGIAVTDLQVSVVSLQDAEALTADGDDV